MVMMKVYRPLLLSTQSDLSIPQTHSQNVTWEVSCHPAYLIFCCRELPNPLVLLFSSIHLTAKPFKKIPFTHYTNPQFPLSVIPQLSTNSSSFPQMHHKHQLFSIIRIIYLSWFTQHLYFTIFYYCRIRLSCFQVFPYSDTNYFVWLYNALSQSSYLLSLSVLYKFQVFSFPVHRGPFSSEVPIAVYLIRI